MVLEDSLDSGRSLARDCGRNSRTAGPGGGRRRGRPLLRARHDRRHQCAHHGRHGRYGLIATEGFRDILEIRRQRQPHNYDIRIPKPPPLVRRHLRREIEERTYLFGPSDVPPDLGALDGILDDFRGEGVEAVAISFLHSYHNPAHEAAVAAAVREGLPDAFVCASHEVVAEFREFERTTTTVLNASLGPVVSRYLERLGERARAMGIVAPKILQSHAGLPRFGRQARWRAAA